MDVAVLGLGEAGRVYARDFAVSGAAVRGFDVRPTDELAGVTIVSSVAEAVRGADLIISLTTSAGATEAARSALPAMESHAIYADFNASSPDLVAGLADLVGTDRFVDVAVLIPALRQGLGSQLLVSGAAATEFASILESLDVPSTIVPGGAGEASRWKLLRSVFMKSLAATILESRAAAAAAGCEDWLLAGIASELGESGTALVTRMIDGTHQHASRRVTEMEAARACITELGTPTDMTDSTITWLRAVADGQRS